MLVSGESWNGAVKPSRVETTTAGDTRIGSLVARGVVWARHAVHWMAGSAILNLLLLLPFEHLTQSAWRLAATPFAIQILAVLFSLVAPVPINNRIAKWTPKSLPEDWSTQEHRWDIGISIISLERVDLF